MPVWPVSSQMSFQKFPEKSPLSVSYRIIIHVGEGCQQYVTDTVPLITTDSGSFKSNHRGYVKYLGCHVSVRAQEEVRETHMLHTQHIPSYHTHIQPSTTLTHTYIQHSSHHPDIQPSTSWHTHTPSNVSALVSHYMGRKKWKDCLHWRTLYPMWARVRLTPTQSVTRRQMLKKRDA